MAQLGGTFDASQVDPSQPQELLPPGDYRVQVINSEMRATKAGTGQYLWLEMDVLDGVHVGRKVYDRINLVNPNQQAVEIAQRTLSAVCHATGRMQVRDSEELHFQPVIVKVAVGKTGYNEVKSYKAIPNAFASRPVAAPVVQGFRPPAPPAPVAPPAQQYQQPAPAMVPPVQQYQQPVPQVAPAVSPAATPVQQLPAAPTSPPPAAGGNGPWKRMG
ncbi:MAG: DUF669 domain-containing protein [Magnetococcales bacterium]|nr:DUF669 domain-containing protein [Magnetococcales bacterium]